MLALARPRTAVVSIAGIALVASLVATLFALAVPPKVMAAALVPAAAAIWWRGSRRAGRIEEALRESERRFRETLETASLVSVWLDRDGRVIFCNRYLLALTEYSAEEMAGRDWFDTFVPPEERGLARARFLRNVRSGKIVAHFESEILLRSGKRRLITWTNTILQDVDGRPVGTSSLGEDVTDRRQADAALRKSEALLRLVWETAADAMRLTDADGKIVLANPAYYRLIGRSPDELVGRSLAEAYAESRGQTSTQTRPPIRRSIDAHVLRNRSGAVGRPAALVRSRHGLSSCNWRAAPAFERAAT